MTSALTTILAEVGLADGVGFDDVFWFAAGAITVLTLVGILFRQPIRALVAFAKWTRQFMEDWSGSPAAPGRDAIPGVMERLNRMDGELSRNSGSTTKDKAALALATAQRVEQKIDVIASVVVEERAAREAWDAQYEEDQRRNREEWQAVFGVVASMIHQSPDQQSALWSDIMHRYSNGTLVPNPE